MCQKRGANDHLPASARSAMARFVSLTVLCGKISAPAISTSNAPISGVALTRIGASARLRGFLRLRNRHGHKRCGAFRKRKLAALVKPLPLEEQVRVHVVALRDLGN